MVADRAKQNELCVTWVDECGNVKRDWLPPACLELYSQPAR